MHFKARVGDLKQEEANSSGVIFKQIPELGRQQDTLHFSLWPWAVKASRSQIISRPCSRQHLFHLPVH